MSGSDIRVIPSGDACGAEIAGIDLSDGLDDASFAVIDEAVNVHSVVVLRGQSITPEHHIELSDRLGGIVPHAFSEFCHPDYPQIFRISNLIEGDKPLGYEKAGITWHSDQSYIDTPPRCTTMYAIEVPEKDGKIFGDTLFASAAAAYDALSDTMKEKLDGLVAVHQFAARKRRPGRDKELSAEQKAANPDVFHPVVRTHPFTGRKCIYVLEGECTGIVGMADEEAVPLIKQLSDHTVRPEFIYRHKWQQGDVIIWDNCSLQHRAENDYDRPLRRHMHRTSINGTKPF
ncbi:MAG TPA: TauD/TfdA family dioxygenase [Rhodospirillaceae bacterium]|nr:taurine dioxygenase [Rhodospirillaceae bacterium]HAT36004.1 TauD/TfdA family dioxygenase [Rhodospirillaceae bacterium]